MNSRNLLVLAPVAFVLTVLSFAIAPGPQSSVVVNIAGVIMPSPTSTATETATPTWTPTPTNTPTPTPTSVPTFTPTLLRAPIPVTARDPNPRFVRVPILMYHYISVPLPDADKVRLDLSVTPTNFEAQMEYLSSEGYQPIRVSDLAEYWSQGKPLPPKPIIITFDDGYTDQFTNALPILKNYKFTATFFVITQFAEEKRPGYMTWDQIEELAIEGMEIGSHSMDHPDLRLKPRAFLNTQIGGSKLLIESRIGTPVKSFCYPSGKYDAQVIDAVRSTGYLAAVTTDTQGTRQSIDDIYELNRIRVRGSYSPNDFVYWLKYYLSNGK